VRNHRKHTNDGSEPREWFGGQWRGFPIGSRERGMSHHGRVTSRKAVGLIILTCSVVACGGTGAKGSTTRNPPVFLTVDGGGFNLDVRSAKTGSVVRTLAASVGEVALSPDGSVAYYESDSPEHPGMFSVPVTGGTPLRVGSGSAPVVSPDNSKLAFALPGIANVVGIYDVAARTTQRVNVTRLVGAGYHLGNTGSLLAWVSNTLLVAIPQHDASFAFARSTGDGSPVQLANIDSSAQKAVVIDLAHATSAHEFGISIAGGTQGVGGPGPSHGSLLVVAEKAIERFMVTPTSITSVGSTPIPKSALVQALSPDGLKALYLVPGGASSPPPTVPVAGVASTAPPAPYLSGVQLWVATIGTTLNSPRLVLNNAQLYRAAW